MTRFSFGLLLSLITAGPLAAQDSAAAADLRALQGHWTMVSATMDGVTYREVSGERNVSGDTTIVHVNDQLLMWARFSLDPSTSPKSIDYQILEGAYVGRSLLGIYRVGDSTISFCIAAAGAARPTEFTTTTGDGRTCSEWKRKAE